MGLTNEDSWFAPQQTARAQCGEHNPGLVKQVHHVLPDDLNLSDATQGIDRHALYSFLGGHVCLAQTLLHSMLNCL